MDTVPTELPVLAERQASDADSLTSTNKPDEMAGEQTWPTADELADGESREAAALTTQPGAAKKSKIKRVPRGTSAYQAAWIFDDADDEDEGEDNEDQDGDAEMEADHEREPVADVSEEEDLVDLDVNAEDEQAMSVTNSRVGKSVVFEDMDMEEETRQ